MSENYCRIATKMEIWSLLAQKIHGQKSGCEIEKCKADDFSLSRALGQTVTEDKSQILRLVAGTIIRCLISSGIPEGNFWPVGADERMFADFPKSQHITSQWVVNFEEYLDNIFSQGISDEWVSSYTPAAPSDTSTGQHSRCLRME